MSSSLIGSPNHIALCKKLSKLLQLSLAEYRPLRKICFKKYVKKIIPFTLFLSLCFIHSCFLSSFLFLSLFLYCSPFFLLFLFFLLSSFFSDLSFPLPVLLSLLSLISLFPVFHLLFSDFILKWGAEGQLHLR